MRLPACRPLVHLPMWGARIRATVREMANIFRPRAGRVALFSLLGTGDKGGDRVCRAVQSLMPSGVVL